MHWVINRLLSGSREPEYLQITNLKIGTHILLHVMCLLIIKHVMMRYLLVKWEIREVDALLLRLIDIYVCLDAMFWGIFSCIMNIFSRDSNLISSVCSTYFIRNIGLQKKIYQYVSSKQIGFDIQAIKNPRHRWSLMGK